MAAGIVHFFLDCSLFSLGILKPLCIIGRCWRTLVIGVATRQGPICVTRSVLRKPQKLLSERPNHSAREACKTGPAEPKPANGKG
eukprot:2208536-Amphidinium_carterae.1